jgi:hypothetical protein
MVERNELEDFFLDCVEEVRKDIHRRRTTSATYSIKKNLKKSTSTKALDPDTQDNQQPKLEQYTTTDKKRVIELLMSNENVLLFLYEKLFPVVSNTQQNYQSSNNHQQSTIHTNANAMSIPNFQSYPNLNVASSASIQNINAVAQLHNQDNIN